MPSRFNRPTGLELGDAGSRLSVSGVLIPRIQRWFTRPPWGLTSLESWTFVGRRRATCGTQSGTFALIAHECQTTLLT